MAKSRILPDVLTLDEQKALLNTFNLRYHSGMMNIIMVELMLTAVLRVLECCKLKWSNLRYKELLILIKQGKGKKDRNIHISESLMHRIKDYKSESPESVYVFATRTGNPQDRSTLNKVVKLYASKAGIEKNVYNHLLRHTALTDVYRRTKDIVQWKSQPEFRYK